MNRRDFLKTVGLAAAAPYVSGCQDLFKQPGGKTSKDRPNIIYILTDDLGWAELGCYGNKFNETPNLDRLARQGMMFTDAYAAAPVCSPTRAALLTGQYPARIGITDYLRPNDAKHLSTSHITIAEMLQRAGYTTGIIGKWHLSGYASAGAAEFPPSRYGFDETIVSENRGIGAGSYFWPYHFNRQIKKRMPGKEHLIDRCNLEAVDFIERNGDRPFFLYLSHYAVHTRLQGKGELVAKYERKPGAGKGNRARCNNPHLAAQLQSIDEGVGLMVNKLDELGLADNTILIFTSDNGGEEDVTSNAPLRAGKSTLYEGGIRVPLIVRWPTGIKPASICSTPTSTVDFYPTFLQLAGIKAVPHQNLDGVSIWPLLKGAKTRLKRDALFWHYPLNKRHFLGGRSSGAVRQGDWKLIEFFDTGDVELYNLVKDISERNNLAKKMSNKTAELQKLLAAWRKDVAAEIPSDQRIRRG